MTYEQAFNRLSKIFDKLNTGELKEAPKPFLVPEEVYKKLSLDFSLEFLNKIVKTK